MPTGETTDGSSRSDAVVRGVGWVVSEFSQLHDPGPGHPECVERLTAITAHLERCGLADDLLHARAGEAEREALLAVHPEDHLRHVEEEIASGAGYVDQPDANVCSSSYQAALGAAGAALLAVDRVANAEWKSAFVSARPPGHHAEESQAMGFCLFNSAAVAVRHAQRAHGLERVAVVDWDVHHGNGTQHIFEQDPSVLYVSLHQYPHYPGTGAAHERGRGAGEGATLNCPQPAGSGDREWLSTFERQVLPAVEAFNPDLVLVSAGFDAHALDPLSSTLVSEAAYGTLTRSLCQVAQSCCAGRLVSLLEGGYSLRGLALSVEQHVAGLVES